MLKPYMPLNKAETHLSWAARLAAIHIRGDLLPFLEDRGVKPRDYLYGDMGQDHYVRR